MDTALTSTLQMWGGIECSVNRVGDRRQNQLQLSGHEHREDDLERVASLGIRTLRYPVLWELVAPDRDLRNADWRSTDIRLQQLRTLGIEPIVGLLHHGSGPLYTNLLAEDFAESLAAFAGAVAQRYPWLTRYTPVNEPLTTARFSALYGLWYPHRSDAPSFLRALFNQCKAIVLSMQAISRVNPAAQLIQTEDLGRVFGSPSLNYQAEFENQRRWLSWDLLCGRVNRSHTLWRYLRSCGIAVDELNWFIEHACPPDVIGINHYVTSDRFLHERPELFAASCRGGNGIHRYADVEAVRVLPEPNGGFADAINAAWQRYRLPMALTEVQLSCSRDEQLRWLYQGWCSAQQARERGVDLRAVTAWALFGSHDWNTLLTGFSNHYESGAWDIRSKPPRRTAVAELIATLAQDTRPRLQHLHLPGWWQRSIRLQVAPTCVVDPKVEDKAHLTAHASANQVLILGATGTLGQAFIRMCELRGLPYLALRRQQLDITQAKEFEMLLQQLQPCAVINATGYVKVDQAEAEVAQCDRDNVYGALNIARGCAAHAVPLVTFSSDLVFDGRRSEPYVESDLTAPLNTYGRSKAHAEELVMAAHPKALVVRTSAFFGPWDDYNFVTGTLNSLSQYGIAQALQDVIVSPTYVPDLVNCCLDLLIDGESGLWHVVNHGHLSWLELGRRAASAAGMNPRQVQGVTLHSLQLPAARPSFSALTSCRGLIMPTLDDALQRYIADRRQLHARAA